MMKTSRVCAGIFLIGVLFHLCPESSALAATRTITDASGRRVKIPQKVDHVICSGPGALRLLTYLQCQSRIVAVDDMEKRRSMFDARPYALANPQFKEYPVFGEFRGRDHPERILTLDPLPQVIFKTYPTMGHDPVELSRKTGIPVIVLDYGNLGKRRAELYRSLRIMGEVMGASAHAEQVIAFFNDTIADLHRRTSDIAENLRPSCFVGGIAYRGPHGFQSTEPTYPPFAFVHARNLACGPSTGQKVLEHSSVAKEKLVVWNPEYLFLDLSTLQMGESAGGLFELKTEPAYRGLTSVLQGRVYGVLPYNWYTRNFGSILANAYFIGKQLYPTRFTDIDPAKKADEIYAFLVGRPIFAAMNAAFGHLAFTPVPLK